jgi:hypothetical protein
MKGSRKLKSFSPGFLELLLPPGADGPSVYCSTRAELQFPPQISKSNSKKASSETPCFRNPHHTQECSAGHLPSLLPPLGLRKKKKKKKKAGKKSLRHHCSHALHEPGPGHLQSARPRHCHPTAGAPQLLLHPRGCPPPAVGAPGDWASMAVPPYPLDCIAWPCARRKRNSTPYKTLMMMMMISTQYNQRPSHGFPHLHKASTENTTP